MPSVTISKSECLENKVSVMKDSPTSNLMYSADLRYDNLSFEDFEG